MLKTTDMRAVNNTRKDYSKAINRVLYTGFTLMAAYFLLARGDYGDAATNLAIALIFDPFNTKQTWKGRAFYQRAWLIVHVLVVFTLFILQFTR
jgi:hypothetical protein